MFLLYDQDSFLDQLQHCQKCYDSLHLGLLAAQKCSISWRTVWMVLTEVKVVPLRKVIRFISAGR